MRVWPSLPLLPLLILTAHLVASSLSAEQNMDEDFDRWLRDIEAEECLRKLKSRVFGNSGCPNLRQKREVLRQRIAAESDAHRKFLLRSVLAYALIHSRDGVADQGAGCQEYDVLLSELFEAGEQFLFLTVRRDFLKGCYVTGKKRRSRKGKEFGALCAKMLDDHIHGRTPPANPIFLARALRATGQWPKAGQVAKAAVEASPASPEILMRSGEILAEMFRSVGEKYLLKAIELAAKDVEVLKSCYRSLSKYYERRTHYPKAFEFQKAYIEACNGRHGYVRVAKLTAECATALGRESKQEELQAIVEEGLRRSPNGEALLESCEMYFEWQDYARAAELAKRAVETKPDFEDPQQHKYHAQIMLGRALYRLGKKAEAKEQLEQALKDYPGRTPLNVLRLWQAREALKEFGLQPPPGHPPL